MSIYDEIYWLIRELSPISKRPYMYRLRKALGLLVYVLDTCKTQKILSALDELKKVLVEKGLDKYIEAVDKYYKHIEKGDYECKPLTTTYRGNTVCVEELDECFPF